nr:MAG: replication associated protein [Cressdnaviricota sp.]
MFTIFPPHGDEEPVSPVFNPKVAKYLVFQLELCPTTKRFHYQTFVIPKSRQQRAKAVRAGLGIDDDVHWDIVKGTRDEAKIYCCDAEKESFIAGGHRTDWDELKSDFQAGRDLRWVAENKPIYIGQYPRGTEMLRSLLQPSDRFGKIQCSFIWGDPGTGKSFSVINKYGRDKVYIKNRSKWWSKYNGEQVVLFDDFLPTVDGIRFIDLLQILDNYKIICEPKGGDVYLRANKFYFTNNEHYTKWYGWDTLSDIRQDAFKRRIHIEYEVRRVGETLSTTVTDNRVESPVKEDSFFCLMNTEVD